MGPRARAYLGGLFVRLVSPRVGTPMGQRDQERTAEGRSLPGLLPELPIRLRRSWRRQPRDRRSPSATGPPTKEAAHRRRRITVTISALPARAVVERLMPSQAAIRKAPNPFASPATRPCAFAARRSSAWRPPGRWKSAVREVRVPDWFAEDGVPAVRTLSVEQPVEAAGRPVTTGFMSGPGRGGTWRRATPAGPHRMCFAGLVAALSRYSRGPRRKKRDQIAANTIAPRTNMSSGTQDCWVTGPGPGPGSKDCTTKWPT